MTYQKIKGNLVHKTAVDWKNLIIGKNNYIGPYVVIGGMHSIQEKNFGKIYIGNNNTINEYSNIHRPTRHKNHCWK